MLSRRGGTISALTDRGVRRETAERLRRMRKGVMISMETQQENGALIMLVWVLCLIAVVGLIVGYIIIKP
jgi:hypothetical protein